MTTIRDPKLNRRLIGTKAAMKGGGTTTPTSVGIVKRKKALEHSGLAVIECRSSDSPPGSLRAHYELIGEGSWDEPAAVSVEIVGSFDQFARAFSRWALEPDCKVLCVTGHGRKSQVTFDDGSTLGTTTRSPTRSPAASRLASTICSRGQ